MRWLASHPDIEALCAEELQNIQFSTRDESPIRISATVPGPYEAVAEPKPRGKIRKLSDESDGPVNPIGSLSGTGENSSFGERKRARLDSPRFSR